MSTYGALIAARSGLQVQAQELGKRGNNIANISTNGYKRILSHIESQVTQTNQNTAYSPGGVRNTVRNTISEQGLIQASNSATHTAISGGGFFVLNSGGNDQTPYFSRDGAFTADNLGNLKLGNFFLQGWLLDINGNPPAANADISSLTPVNTSTFNGIASATTRVEFGMNLNAGEKLGATSIVLGSTPVDATELQAALGNPGVTTDFNISINGGANVNIPILVTDTLAALVTKINTAVPTITATETNGQLVIKANSMTDTITITNGAVGNIVNSFFQKPQVVKTGYDFRRSVTVYDTLGTPREVQLDFKKAATNSWDIEARVADPTLATTVNGLIGIGTLSFNTDGSPAGITGTLGSPIVMPWDPMVTGAGNQTITFDFGVDSSGNKTKGNVTQLTSNYNVNFVNQNGAALGLKTGIAIDKDGYVTASFSNGQFKKLYLLPIATFANPDGLSAKTGNVFTQTSDSGEYNLRQAGDSGAGKIAEGSLELSNVDIATEFTDIIQIQTAYSANTKVISAADQMMKELTNLR
ncbi:MAG: flagellar hook-basal body complex protein [Alphaproteobacteria bacterium]|jgi:flagellar hook protein FlgE|nr:flagellar hook-basal body complex protein [Alphaproteobacteria bacterium]MBP9877527.1 flagellar hook-basal body complex protein [Alphaproteobacteria bacterium]